MDWWNGLGNKWEKSELKKNITRQLECLIGKDRGDDNLSNLIDTNIQLNWEIEKDEVYWEHHARVNWPKLGDKNTSFFNRYASQRRRTNNVKCLEYGDGRVIEDRGEMEKITDFFENLFTLESEGWYAPYPI